MTITHISLKNWKNFTHADVDINQRLFIVGANAAGKSNLLDSFRFLRDITKQGGGLQYAISSRGGLSKIRSLSARKEPDVELSITVQEGETKWFYLLISDGTLRIIGLLWSLFENNGLLLLEETELSLHSAVVENLANILYTAQKAKKKDRLY